MPSKTEFEKLIFPARSAGTKETRGFNSAQEMLRWFNGFYSWRHKLHTERPGDHAQAMRISLTQDQGKCRITIVYDEKPKGVKRMKPVKISRYPDYLIDLAREAGKVRRIPLKDKRAAEALRFDLYGLRRAIEKEGAEDIYPEFMRAIIRIEGGTVIISPPDNANEETRAAVLAALGEDHNSSPPEIRKLQTDPYALYIPPEQHNTALADQEFESAIDAWLASAPHPTHDELEK